MADFVFHSESMEAFLQYVESTGKREADFSKQMSMEGDPVLLYGKLQGLFGKCPYESEDLEEQYTYYISAKRQTDETLFLSVYSGPSGPSICCLPEEESLAAADELVSLMETTEPVDYCYEGIYYDGPGKVIMGIRNGETYYEEECLVPEMEQYDELMDILGQFIDSGWDLIAGPSAEYMSGACGEEELLAAIEEADRQCGSCGCELDPLYKRALELLREDCVEKMNEGVLEWMKAES